MRYKIKWYRLMSLPYKFFGLSTIMKCTVELKYKTINEIKYKKAGS